MLSPPSEKDHRSVDRIQKAGITSLRRPCRLQEGGWWSVIIQGKLIVGVPAGQQAGHAGPDSTFTLKEPVALLVITYTQGQAK